MAQQEWKFKKKIKIQSNQNKKQKEDLWIIEVPLHLGAESVTQTGTGAKSSMSELLKNIMRTAGTSIDNIIHKITVAFQEILKKCFNIM